MELPTDLSSRPRGSSFKIRVSQDGFLILSTILALFRDYKPLTFFGLIGLLLVAAGLIPAAMVVYEFFTTGFVSRMPSTVFAVALVISGMLSVRAGLVLHTTVRRFQEMDHQLQALSTKITSARNSEKSV